MWVVMGLLGTFGCSAGVGRDLVNSHGISGDSPSAGSGGSTAGASYSRLGAASSGGTTSAAGSEAATYTALYFQVAGGDSVCVSLDLPADAQSQVDCKVIEMVLADHCDCSQPGRLPASAEQVATGRSILGGSANRSDHVCGGPDEPSCDRYCGCELAQMTGGALESCRQDLTMASSAAGWCYDDPGHGLGSPALFGPSQGCLSPQSKLLRAQAPGLDASDSNGTPLRQTVFECAKKTLAPGAPKAAGSGELGAACVLSDQQRADFRAFETTEVSIDTNSADCASGLCLVDNRVPYGAPAQAPGEQPESGAQCSCRCDGPAGTGPFCGCPDGFECTPLVHDIGLQSSADVTGSYCIKRAAPIP